MLFDVIIKSCIVTLGHVVCVTNEFTLLSFDFKPKRAIYFRNNESSLMNFY